MLKSGALVYYEDASGDRHYGIYNEQTNDIINLDNDQIYTDFTIMCTFDHVKCVYQEEGWLY